MSDPTPTSTDAGAIADATRSASPWENTGVSGERLGVADFPTFLLERAASLARTKLTRHYLERWKLSVPEWRLLNVVAHASPTSFAEIMRISTMDRAQISLTLRTLAARGWVTVARATPRKPARAVTITPRGQAIIRKVMPEAQRAQMRFLDALMPRDRLVLYDLLRKSVGILNALDGG